MIRFLRPAIVIFIFSFFILSCKSQQKSTVLEFNYGGYDDTVYALIDGKIYERNKRDSLVGLNDVQVKAEQNNKIVFTNSFGDFTIGLEKGTFDLIVSKKGYQSLRIFNFISDPDRLSDTKIILRKGRGAATFVIPDP